MNQKYFVPEGINIKQRIMDKMQVNNDSVTLQNEKQISKEFILDENTGSNHKEPEMKLLNKTVMKGTELIQLASTEVPYLVEGLIPKFGVTFLTGSSDCNKSTLLRQLALAIANGDSTFIDFPLKLRHKKAIMVITEDMAPNIAPLLKKQVGIYEDSAFLENLRFVFATKGVIEELNNLLDEEAVDCIIIDTWTDLFGGDINASNSVRASLHSYTDLIRKHACTIVALHHEKKGSEDKSPSKDNMLGSMGIQAYSRAVLQLKRDGDNKRRKLTPVKGNYLRDSQKNKSIILELDEENMVLINTNEVTNYGRKESSRSYTAEEKKCYEAKIIEYYKAGISQDEIVEKLRIDFPDWPKTPSKGTVNTVLQKNSQEDNLSEN